METLEFIFGQDDIQPFGIALQDSRKFTGKCSDDIIRGVVTMKKMKGNSE